MTNDALLALFFLSHQGSRALEEGRTPYGTEEESEARDLLGCPRKQAQLIMEYFDQQRLTRWDGEKRHWQPSSADASGENKGR